MHRTICSFAALALLVGCASSQEAKDASATSADAVTPAEATHSTNVTGWEGFFAAQRVDDAFLLERNIPLKADVVQSVTSRIAKLVLDGGEQPATEADLAKREAATCTDPVIAAYNVDRCAGLKARKCENETCRYHHFGNCTGFLLGEGQVVTAAHCVATLTDEQKAASSILVPHESGPQKRAFGTITVSKSDFAHDWVNTTTPGAMDVALISGVDDGGLSAWPVSTVPGPGAAVFIMGYPRVEGRSAEALADRKYTLVAGTPALSFGRVADVNAAGEPLCNVDGMQEHWQMAPECPVGEVQLDGQTTWTGPITAAPFLATYDTCNGYSGGPVFDGAGRLVGVNATLMSPHSPQERYSSQMLQVASPAQSALELLRRE